MKNRRMATMGIRQWVRTSCVVGMFVAVMLAAFTVLAGSVHASAPVDFNGDGKEDILWYNTITGTVAIWLMNGTTVIGSGTLGPVGSDWVIAGVGDLNGDGKSDILWRHHSGNLVAWMMDGVTLVSNPNVGSVSSEWSITPLQRATGTINSNITSATVNATTGDASGTPGPAGVSFPIYVAGKYSDYTMQATPASTVSHVVDMVRNRVTLGGFNAPAGGVGHMIYSEFTGAMSGAHQEYYGAAVLSVINQSSPTCTGGCAFPNHASQAFIKSTTDGTVSAYEAQIVNTAPIGAGGVFGLRINNGVDLQTTNLVPATAAVQIGARNGAGAGVEAWQYALQLRDWVTSSDRVLLRNDGSLFMNVPSSGAATILDLRRGGTIEFQVDNTSSATDLNVLVNHNGTLKRAQVAPPNSCGTGFRCLMIPN